MIASLLTHDGMRQVILASSNKEKLDAAVKAVGHNAIGIVTDSTEDDQVKTGHDSNKKCFNRVPCLSSSYVVCPAKLVSYLERCR